MSIGNAHLDGRQCPCGTKVTRFSVTGLCLPCARARSRERISMPDDFAKRAPSLTDTALGRHYGRDLTLIKRWRIAVGIARPAHLPVSKLAVPSDFATNAKTMHKGALARHYGISWNVIVRWCKEIGVAPPNGNDIVRTQRCIAASPIGFNQRAAHWRDTSSAGDAAHFLQRWDPIYRCDPQGNAKPDGECWRHGRAIRSDAEIIERAERKGFDPDAWKRIAA